MSSKKVFKAKAAQFPTEAACTLVDMLRKKVPFDKWKAIYAAMELITYLMSYASDAYSTKSVRAPKASVKVIASTLESVANRSKQVSTSSFDIPVWLLPILIKLLLKWIENNYPPEKKKS